MTPLWSEAWERHCPLSKGLGKGVKSFKDGVNEAKSEITEATKELEDKDTKKE